MKQEDITPEYEEFLLTKEHKLTNEFLKQFEDLEGYRERENFLNEYYNKEIFQIITTKKFLDLFYLDGQAEYILKEISFNNLKLLKTLVYCYNTNSRDFNEKRQEEILKERLLKEGFTEVKFLKWDRDESEEDFNKRSEEYYKHLDGLKVKCVFDRGRVGIMGSYTEKAEHEGKLVYSNDRICFLPKRHTKTGQILTGKFYYKEIKK